MAVDINFMVGGEAGQGVQSVGHLLARALAQGGFHVFADQDYESRIRGGHNFFRVRAGDGRVAAISEDVDVLVALNQETIDLHLEELSAEGVAISGGDETGDAKGGSSMLHVPLDRIAEESAHNKLMANTVALGAALGLVGYDLEILRKVVREHFGPGEVGDANDAAVAAGYRYAREKSGRRSIRPLTPVSDGGRMLLSGNEAVALGALAAGCRFMAAYPMTPSTSIMEYMAAKADDLGLVVVQPEDEISAVNMIIGAAFAGVRSMTATSGSGFCLMVEGLGLAGGTETPIVIVNGQRPGPATGLPTRTEQADLEFAVYASHGEFPRAVLAPATVEDGFWLTVKAFNLADRYQVPVILLTDQHLASSYATVDRFELSKVDIDRGALLSDAELVDPAGYRRHRITDSGVSPRALPSLSEALVVTDADEHGEDGHMIEDVGTRSAMVLKRLRKLEGLRGDMGAPRLYGPAEADVTLLGWGSTFGALSEAVDLANRDGARVNLVHLSEIWPLPVDAVSAALNRAKRTVAVENNATAQLSHLVRAETGHQVAGRIVKFDGRPFTAARILAQLREVAP